jgi:hypothetical protein
MKQLYTGVAIKNISKTNIEQIKIQIPSLERQKEIVEYLEYNDKLIKNLEKEIENNKKQAQQFIRGIVKTSVDNEEEHLTQTDNEEEDLTKISENEDEYNYEEELTKTEEEHLTTTPENENEYNEEDLTKTPDNEEKNLTTQTTQTDDEEKHLTTQTTQTDDEKHLTQKTQTDDEEKHLTKITQTQTEDNEEKNMNCIFIITKGHRKNEKCGIKTKNNNTFCIKHTK